MKDENRKTWSKNSWGSMLEHCVDPVLCVRKVNYLDIVISGQGISFAGLILCSTGYSSIQIYNGHRSP